MTARSHYLSTYTPTFSRRLNSYVNNGFFARDLDADDYAFIESIRDGRCGVIGADRLTGAPVGVDTQGGSIRYAEERSREADRSHSTYFDPEMMEYWQHRWAFEAIGDAERREVYAQQQRERQEERARWAQERETMRGELAREEMAWQQKQETLAQEREKRLRDTMQADREWEEAGRDAAEKLRLQEAASAILQEQREGRQKAKWAKFWDKARAQEWVKDEKARQEKAKSDADLERLKQRVRKQAAKRKRQAEEAELRALETEEEAKRAKAREAANAKRLAEAEARQTAWVAEQDRQAAERARHPRNMAKDRMCLLIINAWPKRWTMQSLMAALNVKDEQLVHQLGQELVREGRLQLLPEAYGGRGAYPRANARA